MSKLKSIAGGGKDKKDLADMQRYYDNAIAKGFYERAEMIAEAIEAYYLPQGKLNLVGDDKTPNTKKYKYVGNENLELIIKGILGDNSAWDYFHKKDKELTEGRSKIKLVKPSREK